MKLVIGLGNPGDKYKNTRHNVGFMVTGLLAEKHGINGKTESKFNAILGKGKIADEDVIIAQPLTYMNLSGEALSKIMNFYKIDIKDILVIFDDISLDIGVIRFKANGSDGGHNGIKSVTAHLGGNKNFARLKIGIGPQPKGMPSENFVLQNFSKSEMDILDKVIKIGVDAVEDFLSADIASVQNKYNGINLN